ncbi:MAG TPA: molybdopterin-dependent oxidoreductase [Clostridiaceae bacterium]
MKRIIFLIISLMNLLLLASCTGTDGISSATESRYQESEIREYNGVRLDPSVGLRDNSIKGIQHVDISTYTLKVSGLVKNPVSLAYNDILALPAFEKLITLHCVEGWDATVLWKGVLLKDIIGKASAESTANTVIFHSVDGYTTSLPLQAIIDKNIILAYSSNRITLPAELGYPFIVVAEDKLGYKWARWVTEIELSDNPNYKGYWETRGFDNNADVK